MFSQANIIIVVLAVTFGCCYQLCGAKRECPPWQTTTIFPNQTGDFVPVLWQLLEYYPNWLKESNLDPSIPISQPTNIRSNYTEWPVVLDWEIWNYYVSGMSARLEICRVYGYIGDNVASISLDLFFRDNITFGGEYTANGTVAERIPLSGSGNWKIISSFLEHWFSYDIEVSTDGNVSVIPTGEQRSEIDSEPKEFEFDGLLDNGVGGYEYEVIQAVHWSFIDFMERDDYSGIYPGRDTMTQYLQKIFSEPPLSEMFGSSTHLKESASTGAIMENWK